MPSPTRSAPSLGVFRRHHAPPRGGLSGALQAGLDAHIHYAVKANDHLAVLRVFARGRRRCGRGQRAANCCRAREAGIPPARIVFSGVGKTGRRTTPRTDRGHRADQRRKRRGTGHALGRRRRHRADGAGRAAGQPGRGCRHAREDQHRARGQQVRHPRMPTRGAVRSGRRPARASRRSGLRVHIGSQVSRLRPYRAAFARLAELVRALRARRPCGVVRGLRRRPRHRLRDEPAASPAALAGAMRAAFGGLGVRLLVEPGRWLVGPAGVLLASVVLVKQAGGRRSWCSTRR